MAGTWVQQASEVVPRLRQAVSVNGSSRPDVFCTSVTLGSGTAGSQATLEFPALLWDGGKSWLRGSSVVVRAGYEGQGMETVFAGYIQGVDGRLPENAVGATAVSLAGMLDNVFVGQHWGTWRAFYPERAVDPSGVVRATGWTIKSILRDLFSSNPASWRGGGGGIGGGWRSRLELGSLSVLSEAWNSFPIGDQAFEQTSLAEALDQLLATVGTVSFRESFSSNGDTRLDFYELADPTAPKRVLRVARVGEAARSSNVLTISHSEGMEDVRTRMVALGDRERVTVSVATNHPTAPLVRAWDPSLEAAVLADPERAKRGRTSGDAEDEAGPPANPALLNVFRRYRLPVALRGLDVDENLAVELSDGSKPQIQVWRFPRVLTDTGTGWTGVVAEAPVLLEGTEFDLRQGYLVLAEPAVDIASVAVGVCGREVTTYVESVVGVTLTFSGERLRWDTGVASTELALPGIGSDGLTEVIANESFRRWTIAASNLQGHAFPAWIFLEGTGWLVYEAPVDLVNDSADLQYFAEQALAEKKGLRAQYDITSPYWLGTGLRIGDRIEVVGQDDAAMGTHQIQSVSHNLTADHGTTLSTDNAVPLINNQVLGV